MQTTHDYWSVILRTYLKELRAGERMQKQKAILNNDEKWAVVQAGVTEIRARICRAIDFLGGMAGEW